MNVLCIDKFSANKIIMELLILVERVIMKILNTRCSRVKRCGTPDCTEK
jgi:hypothetical protein